MIARVRYMSVGLVLAAFGAQLVFAEAQWPAWRGADGSGVAAEGNPPTQWSETENVKWKTALPGDGQSTPVIWADKIFLQAAVALMQTSEEAIKATTSTGDASLGNSHPNERSGRALQSLQAQSDLFARLEAHLFQPEQPNEVAAVRVETLLQETLAVGHCEVQ